MYDGVPVDVRTRRHRRIARILTEAPVQPEPDLAAEIAVHFERGGDAPQAARYYVLAARRSLALCADDDALAQTQRALDLATTRAAAMKPPCCANVSRTAAASALRSSKTSRKQSDWPRK